MRFDVITIFPEVIDAISSHSILKRAKESGLIAVNAINLRDFARDRHRTVDDYPYGGGAGMVLKPEPVFAAVEHLCSGSEPDHIIAMTPGGKPFVQADAVQLARCRHLIIICGHYEGIDQRILDHLVTTELSIGDYVVTGGELPAMVVVDAVARLIPGVLGNRDSAQDESFQTGLLEYPHYTRPREFRGLKVPEILLSGNHQQIECWRRRQALEKTRARRPELLNSDP